MSTLNVVEEILRDLHRPLVVREIVEIAGPRLPTKSKTPDTVVARDLAMDIKKRGLASKFCRVAPGKYTLREYAHEFAQQYGAATTAQGSASPTVEPASMQASPASDA